MLSLGPKVLFSGSKERCSVRPSVGDREDPLRAVAANAAFLQASLFPSVVAFGTAAMAILVGLLFILIGLGMRDVEEQLNT